MQNNKPVKIFQNAIRTNLAIYKQGTISTCSSVSAGTVIQCMFYKLQEDGTEKWEAGYEGEMGENLSYKKLHNPDLDSEEPMIEVSIDTINETFKEIDIIKHLFKPFVLDGEELELGNDEIEHIVRESYNNLEKTLMGIYIKDLFDKHHSNRDGQKIWRSGLKPGQPLYEDIYELLYPEVKDMAVEEGMTFLINEAYTMFWQPPAPISFYGPPYDLKVLSKDSDHFTVKQTKAIGPQDIGEVGYDIVYIIEFIKEEGKWMFAGAKKQE